MLARRYLSLFAFMLIGPAAALCGDVNVLVNPGFESGMDGWASRNATLAAVTAPVHGGAQSAKVSGRSANWQGIKQSLWGKLVEGRPYRLDLDAPAGRAVFDDGVAVTEIALEGNAVLDCRLAAGAAPPNLHRVEMAKYLTLRHLAAAVSDPQHVNFVNVTAP